jgi:hypothetical protein
MLGVGKGQDQRVAKCRHGWHTWKAAWLLRSTFESDESLSAIYFDSATRNTQLIRETDKLLDSISPVPKLVTSMERGGCDAHRTTDKTFTPLEEVIATR